jgi:ribose 5-phosphate isomerase A
VSDREKRLVAEAALAEVQPGSLLGVGTGSTANHFIDGLGRGGVEIEAAVASSLATAERLAARGVRVVELAEVERLPLYVDGADEVDPGRNLIKGGGGALTREKIVAAASERFVCIVDDSKLVERLGAFPLPVVVLALARRPLAAELERLGGRSVERAGFVTDNGHIILDVHDLRIEDPAALEGGLNQLAGVVTNGLFARRGADLVLSAGADGVRRL